MMTREEAISVIENEIQIDVRLCTDEQVDRFQTALYMAISALRSVPTGEPLGYHFPDTTKIVPLTLEQLRKMDWQPVWVKVIGKTGICCDGWCEVEIKEKDPFAFVWWPGSEVEDIAKIEDYGKTWACYAYQPAHIDREVWEPCAKCVGCGNCYYFLYDDDEYPCDKCSKGSTAKNPYPEFKPIGFCKHCGRPLTEKAWAELEKRMGVR